MTLGQYQSELRSLDASAGEAFRDPLQAHGVKEVTVDCAAADAAFPVYRAFESDTGAAFLERIAEEIVAIGDWLIVGSLTMGARGGLRAKLLDGEAA